MSRGPDAAALLERALIRAAIEAGVAMSVAGADWTRWASATFVGARHALRLVAMPSAALDRWVAGLSEAEFRLRGHLVADLAIVGTQREAGLVTVCIEALTVESH